MEYLTFTNLAQFRKLLRKGQQIETIYHKEFAGRHEDGSGRPVWKDKHLGIRTVSIVQSNSFAIQTAKIDGSLFDSWCQYPKASEVKIIDNSKLEIYEQDGSKVLTYSFPK